VTVRPCAIAPTEILRATAGSLSFARCPRGKVPPELSAESERVLLAYPWRAKFASSATHRAGGDPQRRAGAAPEAFPERIVQSQGRSRWSERRHGEAVERERSPRAGSAPATQEESGADSRRGSIDALRKWKYEGG